MSWERMAQTIAAVMPTRPRREIRRNIDGFYESWLMFKKIFPTDRNNATDKMGFTKVRRMSFWKNLFCC
jgi:hypothetical protein